MKTEIEIRQKLWHEFTIADLDGEQYADWLEAKFIELFQAVEKVMENL